jgi:hypothetical protein
VGIYRNNLREGFIKVLALEFPVIRRLVGEDYFHELGRAFLADHPSRSGNLHGIGEPFGAFLRRRFEGSPYSYLPDVAELEWAYQESLVATDATPFDLNALRQVPATSLASLHLALQPACRLVRSAYPIMRIWSVNQPGSDDREVVDLQNGSDCVLVRRITDGAELRRLPPAEYQFLESLAHGSPLGDALEAAQGVDAAIDVGDVLRRCIALDIFTGPPFLRSLS